MNKTTQYKDTPIGPIPADWEVKKLGEITFGKGTYGINASAVPYSEELPKYLRITDIDDEGYFTTEKLSSVDDATSNEFVLNENDIVFVRTGSTTGKTYLYDAKDGKLVYAGFLIKFSIDHSKADKYFIWSFTKSDKYNDWVTTFSQRSGQPGLNSNEFASLHIPLPPLPEQQKIAEILSTWDKAIQETTSIIKKLEERNKALAFSLLTGKKRVKGFEGKWKSSNFGDITNKVSRRNKTLVDAPVYSVTNSKGFVLQSEHFDGKVAGEDLSNYKIIYKNEFAYNPARINVGSLAYFENEIGVISSLYVCFKTNKQVSDDFLNYYLKTDYVHSRINALGEGGVRIYLWYELFSKIKIKLPSIEEQNAIASILNTANEELKHYQQKLDVLKTQKKGLMQQLITGKIRTI